MFSSPLKRFYGFVLKRLVGNFLEDELQLEQLDVQLLEGVVSFSDLALDTQVLNDMVKDLPLSFVRAKLRNVTAKVPWTNVLNESCEVRVDGLDLYIVPSCEAALGSGTDDVITSSRQALLARSLAELDGDELRQKIRLHKQLQKELAQQERQLHRQDVLREQLAHSTELRSPSEAAASDLDESLASLGVDGSEDLPPPDEGVQVLTSFLERILSRIEVDVRDINIYVEHEGGAVFKLFIPRIAYGGGREEEKMSSADGSSERQRGTTTEEFEYHKTIRFRGFRVQVAERKGAPFRTILAHGDIDRDCEIQLKLFLGTEQPNGPRIDINCFIASLRLLVRPSDLARLSDLLTAVRVSSQEIAARHPRQRRVRRSKGHLLADAASDVASSALPAVDDDDDDDDDDESRDVDIWSMVVNVRQCKFAVLECDDAQWPEDWELSPAAPDTPSHFVDERRVRGELPRLLGDHLMFSLQHCRVAMQQSSVTSAFALTVAHVILSEFLLCPDGHTYNRYCLMSREDDKPTSARRSHEERHMHASHIASDPHLRIVARSRVERVGDIRGSDDDDDDAAEDEGAMSLHFEPTALFVDVGIGSRLRQIAQALSETGRAPRRPRFPTPKPLDESFETLPEDHLGGGDDDGKYDNDDVPSLVIDISKAVVTLRFPSLIEDRPRDVRDALGPTRDETVRITFDAFKARLRSSDVQMVFSKAFVYLEEAKVLSVLGDDAHGSPQLRIETRDDAAASSRDDASRASSVHTDDLFFQSLPVHRVWEDHNDGNDNATNSQAQFETACLDDSATVLSWEVPTLLVSLSKEQFDLLMLLYNISVETRLVESTEEDDEEKGRVRVVRLDVPPEEQHDDAGLSSLSPSSASSSQSSFSSGAGDKEDTEDVMFKSVVDLTQSVFLQPRPDDDDDIHSNTGSTDSDTGDDVFHSIIQPPPAVAQLPPSSRSSSSSSSSSSSPAEAEAGALPQGAGGRFRHFMSLRVWIGHASLSVTLDQTFLMALDDVDMLQCVMFEGEPMTFVSVGARDVALFEYETAVQEPEDLRRLRSMPFLYKTIKQEQPSRDNESNRVEQQRPLKATCVDDKREEQVFRLTVVMKQQPSKAKRDILAVMNFRDLTLQYVMESLWISKLTDFFSSPPPTVELPVVEDSVKLFVNAYDCALDFNPPAIPSRLVFLLGLVRVSTKLVYESTVSSFTIDVRDGAVLLKDRSDKVVPTIAQGGSRIEHPSTFGVALYHLTGGSLTDVLLDSGYVRVADANFVNIFMQSMPKELTDDVTVLFQRTEVTNGILNVYACGDSFCTLMQIVNQMVEEASASSVLEVTGETVNGGDDGNMSVVERQLQAALAQALLDPVAQQPPEEEGNNRDDDDRREDDEEKQHSPHRRRHNQHHIHVIDDYKRDGGRDQRRHRGPGGRRRPGDGPPPPPPEQVARWVDDDGRLPRLAENYFRLEQASEDEDAGTTCLRDLDDRELQFPASVSEVVLRHIDMDLKLFGGLDWPHKEDDMAAVPSRFAHVRAAAVAAAVAVAAPDDVEEKNEEEVEEEEDEEEEENEVFHAYGAVAQAEHLEDYFGGSSSRSKTTTASSGTAAAAAADPVIGEEDEPLLLRRSSQRNTKEVVVVQIRDMTVHQEAFNPDTESVLSKMTVAVRELELVDALECSDVNKLVCFYQAPGSLGRETNSYQLLLNMATIKSEVEPAEHDRVAYLEEVRVCVEFLPVKLNLDQDTMTFLSAFFSHELDVDPNAPEPPMAFFQSFETRGFVLCIDYSPKHVDVGAIRHGDYGELVNLFPLQNVELRLSPLRLAGIHGWGNLITAAFSEWLRDVGETQSHRYLSGVQPVRSLVNVGHGVADLVLMPLAQVKRDGRLFRGLQKGSKSFLRALALETMKVTTSLATGTQAVLENVDHALGTKGRGRHGEDVVVVVRTFGRLSDPPADVSEGLQQAYNALSRGLKHAAHNIVAIPRDEYVTAGAKASIKSVITALPRAVLKTMIGASEALSKALLGIQHTVNPQGKADFQQRYKKKEFL